ncbi:MAG: hypothetical protein ACREC6_05970, partial [Hyphomicrobiaceae bacterium]
IRTAMKDRTLVATVSGPGDTDGFDRVLSFEGVRLAAAADTSTETRPSAAFAQAAVSGTVS